ncbi:MAG: SDR family oxidoreductase, partial [Defluviicoccus sp.]|nr:SDR family oxidoreductase [Defluviicoccus sp.]
SVSPNRTGSPVGIQEVDPDRYFKNLVNRAGVPDDTAQVVAFLCSDAASFVCGENIFADGGVMAMEAS